MAVTRLAIVGTGLIGASVGLAARTKGITVTGWDPDDRALAAAAGAGALEPRGSLDAAVDGAELVLVAAPIAVLPELVVSVLAATGDETTVTDVGSTKASVMAAAGSPRFVGGHPIAGKEAHGAEHATAELFDGATWFLASMPETDPERYALVHGFVADLGAYPQGIAPDVHDRLVALTSHVPHVLANVIVNQAGARRIEGYEPLANAGGSLRDMTRIAGANPHLWGEIFLDNADAVRDELAEHRRRISEVEAALERGDADFLGSWIGEAARNRRRMLDVAYGDAGLLQRVQVHVADRPNVLAEITQAFGAERINISDFELEHVSPERGGTLTLLVAGEGEAARAATLLEGLGYGVAVSAVLDEA